MTDRPDPHQFRTARGAAGLLCEVRQGMAPWRRFILAGLSTSGFSIERFGPADPEAPVRLRMAGLRVLSARLVTQQGDTIHCRFDTPLHEAVLAHIIQGGA